MAKGKKTSKSSDGKSTASTKATGTKRSKARPGVVALQLPQAASITAFASPAPSPDPLSLRQGARPAAETVLFVHGIGNKPAASVLKCQWDTGLFGLEMGDRTRLAYWVDRDRYPTPEAAGCADADDIPLDEVEAAAGLAIAAHTAGHPTAGADDDAAALALEIEALTDDPGRRAFLERLAARALDGSDQATREAPRPAVGIRVLPLPRFMRRRLVQATTQLLLRDVYDFFFVPERREPMLASVVDRLRSGGGPFVVVAHSQGSMIAYEVLRQLDRAEVQVPLFVTIGSPLGLTEVKDVFREWTGKKRGKLPFPPCVDRWVNVADRLDPVALDTRLNNDFDGEIEDKSGWFANRRSPRSPHSASGYLANDDVRDAVRETVGNAFSQAIGGGIITKDLVTQMEDGAAKSATRCSSSVAATARPAVPHRSRRRSSSSS